MDAMWGMVRAREEKAILELFELTILLPPAFSSPFSFTAFVNFIRVEDLLLFARAKLGVKWLVLMV